MAAAVESRKRFAIPFDDPFLQLAKRGRYTAPCVAGQALDALRGTFPDASPRDLEACFAASGGDIHATAQAYRAQQAQQSLASRLAQEDTDECAGVLVEQMAAAIDASDARNRASWILGFIKNAAAAEAARLRDENAALREQAVRLREENAALRGRAEAAERDNAVLRRGVLSIERHDVRAAMEKLGANQVNSSPLTPLGFLERAATAFGDCTSVVYHGTAFTWSQTFRRCLRLASALVSLGISRRDVVSVLLPNVPAMYEAHFGVPMSGAVLHSINTRLDARTASVLLRHSGSKLVFVDPALAPLLDDALRLLPPGHPAPRVVLVEDHQEKDLPPAPATSLTYERLIEMGDPEFAWVRPASEWDPLVLNYTSGTTAAPKGVVHCHRCIFLVTVDSLVDWAVPPRPTYLWTLPMFHGNGWSFPWGMAVVGGTNVCLRRVDVAEVYDTIVRRGVTHLCAAPVVLNMLANAPEGIRKLLPGKVRIMTAGAPPPAAVLHRAETIGFEVSHGYGLTETGGHAVSCVWKREWDSLPATERARLKARQGVRTPGTTEVDIVDRETGKSVPRDGVSMGEIVLRGGSIMLGYLNDDEATSAAIRDDGWFYTGDVGVMHADGYLEIRDRSKDVIISGGENISSMEIESVLYGHPAVNEAAVVARPDEFWGETPCAFVSLKDGAVGVADVIAWCRERMPHYMVPKTVVFRAELPRTSTGKIQKYVLRNLAKELGSPRL